jgi:integrase/recombinase XerD
VAVAVAVAVAWCGMSPLREALADYLRLRRRLGYEMPQDGRLLEGFVVFLEQAGAERITTELALTWARLPAGAHPHRWRQRLGVARGFARHLATLDPASEIPSADLLPGTRPRRAPHIYTDAEIAALIAAAGELRPRLRAVRHQTLIGLMAVTGMRPGEALALDRDDVDLRHGTVHVRAGKQHKQREVPLHDTTIVALRDYARMRDARFPAPSTPAFFISARGRRMGRGELSDTFPKLIREIGLEGRGARARPRAHDLRHALAVRTLIDWQHAGEDIDRRMPLLSTFLGHVSPTSTYWYLETIPELMEHISRRLEQLDEVLP